MLDFDMPLREFFKQKKTNTTLT